MNEATFMLSSKKFVICCEKSFFIHLCTDGWQLKLFGNATQDCLEEHFIVYNFLCSNLFDGLPKMVDIHDLCLNCKRHFFKRYFDKILLFLRVNNKENDKTCLLQLLFWFDVLYEK